MYKFFVENKQIKDNQVIITGGDVNHIRNVLRLEIGKKIYICNKNAEKSYECIITEIHKDCVISKIVKELPDSNETNTYIHIFQGLPKADKLEWIIEKATEIGVKEITPVIMKRTIIKLDEKDKIKRTERWRKIAEVASKQSGRDKILKVNSIINFKNIFENLLEYDIVVIAYEKEKQHTLKDILAQHKTNIHPLKIAVLIGPEGGIDEQEIELLQLQKKVQIVTLGKRILRTETAPLVIASNILYEMEE